MKLRCVTRQLKKPSGRIQRDDIVRVENPGKRQEYPEHLRRIVAIVEVKGEDREMTFFTNNFEWAASSLCDLYRARWNIETFFKQIKQTLHLGDFLGHNRSAIEWQIWTALLMYLLLRFLHTCSDWTHSFTRLFTCLRAVLWQRRYLLDYLRSYGTAGGSFRLLWAPQQAFLPGFG
jgi:IS4 transposase